MQHLKLFLFVVFATLLIEGREIHEARKAKDSKFLKNFDEFKRALFKSNCKTRPRPGSYFCKGKRDTVVDANNEMPPPPVEEFSKARRDDVISNRGLVTEERETNTFGLPNETIMGESPWE